MITLIANHLWQSTVFAAVCGLLTVALRNNRAQVRHWLWVAASVKFLVPFAALIAVGQEAGWRLLPAMRERPLTLVMEFVGEPFPLSVVPAFARMSAAVMTADRGTAALVTGGFLAIWIAGGAALLGLWLVRWRRVSRAVKVAAPMEEGRELAILRRLEADRALRRPLRFLASDAPMEPGVFGILRPVLLWPRGLSAHLHDRQVEAIIAHELSHVIRRDNLVAAVHMLVQAAFWFHPLVWWVGARLVAERERACDEYVIRQGSEPQVYAESILKTCEFSLEGPLVCVAGVTGSDLRRRIEAIMRNHSKEALSTWKRALLTLGAVLTIGAPLVVGLLNAPRIHAQSFQPAVAGGKPVFEVATVKRNTDPDGPKLFQAQPGGRVNLINQTVREVIYSSYQTQSYRIIGGPEWLNSDRFDIIAKSEGESPLPERLAMVRTLLADRFKLVMHAETRPLPIFALVVASNDGKLGAQLKPVVRACGPGTPPKPPLPDGRPACGQQTRPGVMIGGGMTMDGLANRLGSLPLIGRPVVNQTALNGLFDYDLAFTPNLPTDSAPAPDVVSVFTALQEQLGLKLQATKGSVEILVIDHVQPPTPD